MSETFMPAAQPNEDARAENKREAGQQEFVLRINQSTAIVALAAFAIGVLVGFVLD